MAAIQPAATGSSRLDRLRALRAAQEAALSGQVPLRDLATISREYRATLAEIDELEPKKAEGDGIDEIAQRRAARRSGAAASTGRAKRQG